MGQAMRTWICLFGTCLLLGCTVNEDLRDLENPQNPGNDGGVPPGEDGGVSTGTKPTAAACATGGECAGGTCLGAPGQPEDGNLRFAGGYCTTLGCTPDSQEGCGPDEFCIDGGARGGICVEICSKSEGVVCEREDHVCLGLGTFGGCFSQETVECHVQRKEGCEEDELCVRIGFRHEDRHLGRCHTVCDPMNDRCDNGRVCYYIRTYNAAFCQAPGITPIEESCSCDKCCEPGLVCTPDSDGSGRHCKEICLLATGAGCAAGEECVPLKVNEAGEAISLWGGCVAPGSAGTPK